MFPRSSFKRLISQNYFFDLQDCCNREQRKSDCYIPILSVVHIFHIAPLIDRLLGSWPEYQWKICFDWSYCHIFPAYVLFIEFLYSLLWFDPDMAMVFNVTGYLLASVCGLGYIFFGRKIIRIFDRSSNLNPDSTDLPVKIICFTTIYIVMTIVVLVLISVQVLGGICTAMTAYLMVSIQVLVTVCILFVPPLIYNRFNVVKSCVLML